MQPFKTNSTPTQTTAENAPVEVLTREKSIAERITPTGRKAVLVSTPQALWSFRLEGAGNQPSQTAMWHTSMTRAEKAMLAYLNAFWDQTEKKKK